MLPLVQRSINTQIHEVIGVEPARIVFGGFQTMDRFLLHRQSGVLQDPGLLRCRGRMPAPGNGPKIALKGLYPVYSLTKMFKKEFGRRQDSGILPALWRYFKVLCPALRCSNGSNRRPWNATHRTHQRTDTHVHDSRRHPSICRGAYHGQDRVEDTPP